MRYCIGLTGGIGSGKSTVAALFKDLGAAIVDCDAISRQLTQPGGASIPAIRAAFGDSCINADGALDRVQMRKLVFSDSAAKQRLEAILHPMIRERVRVQIEASNPAPYVLLVVPLLLETQGYLDVIQRTLVVDCSPETQVMRTTRRSGLSEKETRAIMAQQVARTERLKRADDIINNDSDLAALRQQVEALHRRYMVFSTEKA